GRAELSPEERSVRINAAMALIAATLGLTLHGLLDAGWLYIGIQLTLLLQAALLWRLAMPDDGGAPVSVLTRITVPSALLIVAIALLSGAGTAQMIAEARDTKDPSARKLLFQDALINAPTNAAYLRWAAPNVPPEQGLEYLQRAIRVEPTNSSNYLALGDFEIKHSNFAAAEAAYQRAEALQPHFFPASYGLATACWQQGKITQSRLAVQHILQTIGTPLDLYHPVEVPEPWYTLAWYAEGDLARRAGEGNKAISAYEEALDAAAAFQAGSTGEEAQAMVNTGGNTDILRVSGIVILAHARIADLAQRSDPEKARGHRAANADAPALPKKLYDTPFPFL
ncbi:MAG TPA: hypothetical protein VGM23_09835, partial [Armatimonadota bacterium]